MTNRVMSMMCVRIEVTIRPASRLVWIAARNIAEAVDLAARLYPGCDARVVFPIDGVRFFDSRDLFAESEADRKTPVWEMAG